MINITNDNNIKQGLINRKEKSNPIKNNLCFGYYKFSL